MPQTFDSITTFTLGSANASIDITGISQSYTDLYIVCGNLRATTNSSQCDMRFNGDTSSNYAYQMGYFNGNNNFQSNNARVQPYLPISTATDVSNTYLSSFYMNINNYSNTSRWKTMQVNFVQNRQSSGGLNDFFGLWQSNSGINRITLTMSGNTFLAGTTVSIYGILRA
jgi:hypothetical protein